MVRGAQGRSVSALVGWVELCETHQASRKLVGLAELDLKFTRFSVGEFYKT